MAKIIIDIDDKTYKAFMELISINLGRSNYKGIIEKCLNAIKHGKVLPKGYGRLIDDKEQGTPYIQAIYTEALEEGIRCAMCTNTIKSDTGCDGGCIVDTRMYNKVMTEINSRLLRRLPREGHWIDIKNKNGTVIAVRCSKCGNSPKHAIKSDFCPNCGADMREVKE